MREAQPTSLRSGRVPCGAWAVLALAGAVAGCGAKTGLEIPDASLDAGAQIDAGMDAGPDAAMEDAGPDAADAAVCMRVPLAVDRRGAQVVLAIDRSGSMDTTIDGREPMAGELSRWGHVALALEGALDETDSLLEIGAKFFPERNELGCGVTPSLHVVPATGGGARVLSFFSSTSPRGGTPTATALRAVSSFFAARPDPTRSRFVVLATDGGPNCAAMPTEPGDTCLCTGARDACLRDVASCIDEVGTLEVIRVLHEGQSIPVYVIGIDDPTRPELGDVLDRMAVIGGRAREEIPGERRFFSVRRPEDLADALGAITSTIARCVFTFERAPGPDEVGGVLVDGALVPHDPRRTEGWDFSNPARTSITLFGDACERASAGGTPDIVTADFCRHVE